MDNIIIDEEYHLDISSKLRSEEILSDKLNREFNDYFTYYNQKKLSLTRILTMVSECCKTNIVKKRFDVALELFNYSYFQNTIANKPEFLLNVLYYCQLKKGFPNRIFSINLIDLSKYSELMPIRTLNSIGFALADKAIRVKVQLKKVSNTIPMLTTGYFICKSCGKEILAPQSYMKIVIPVCINKCDKRFMTLDDAKSTYLDIQKLDLQEPQENLKSGESPKSVSAFVESVLCNLFTPGKELFVVGILKKYSISQKNPFFDYYLKILSYNSTEKESLNPLIDYSVKDLNEFKAFSKDLNYWAKLTDEIAPSIKLKPEIKSALLLQLVGGCGKQLPNKTRLRGDIHILLIGDPSLGKSQILKSIIGIVGGIYTSGSGSSAAGLTAAVVKDDLFSGRWSVEAGALVCADQSLVALDELDKVKPTELGAIHEAMEQQTVSIAKAGIMMTLNSRCAVLAAANPILGRFNLSTSVESQITMPVTLLSRFDLIFVLQDVINKEKDNDLADHILNTHKRFGMRLKEDLGLPLDFLKKYIRYCRQLSPLLNKNSIAKIKDKYLELRSSGAYNITPRQLESIIRLSEAKAKSRLSDYVSEEDVAFVFTILDKSMYSSNSKNFIDLDLIESGVSKKDKSIMSKILETLKSKPLLSHDLLLDDLKKFNFADIDILHAIDKLKKKGYIFEPQSKKYDRV